MVWPSAASVMIEARIVETTKNWARSLGLDWQMEGVADAAHGNTTGLVFPNNISGTDDAPTATAGASLLTGGANGFLDIGLGNILNTFELDVILIAAENEGLVLSRQQLLDNVWGHGWYGDERTVDVHVRQLRKKLGAALPLATVWGVGYRLG